MTPRRSHAVLGPDGVWTLIPSRAFGAAIEVMRSAITREQGADAASEIVEVVKEEYVGLLVAKQAHVDPKKGRE